ncbi:MAG: S8 family serine peptidase [Elusimicrobia bacterium]|nr:S8 family serine peptidase [Elusimicrobiota bacterium]
MKKTKTALSLSLFICACMLGVTPGLHSYQLAAAVIQAQIKAVPGNAGIGVVGPGLTNAGGLTAAPGLSLQGASLFGTLNANSPVPQLKTQSAAAPAQSPVVAPVAVPVAAQGVSPIIIRQAVIQASGRQAEVLAAALPQAEQSQDGSVRSAFVQLQQMVLSLTKKGSRGSKGMPDYDGGSGDHIADPDGSGSGIDPLGNPSRDPDRDTGPDSRDGGDSWDGGGRSGGSELFQSPVAGMGAGLKLFAPAAPADTKASPVTLDNSPVDLIVMFGDSAKPVTRDEHLSLVDVDQKGGVSLFAFAQQRIMMQLGSAGLEADTMAAYNATPIATYARINAATIRVEAGRAAEFRKLLEGRGFKVYDNARRHIVEPVPVKPEDMDPSVRGAVGMEENLKISKADTVQALAKKAWGAPELGFLGRLIMKVFGASIPQPAVGVIDTGADLKHPLLKRVKALVNATSGPNIDDNGHGSWVTSMILNFAPWLKNLTHYKVFTADGGATLDDILKALTMAGNDGNLIVSNSWGDDEGDPQGPDAQLVRKLAQEGHIMVFAAGNAGPRANTVGAPAIVSYKDAKTGAIRVVSVAGALSLLAMVFGVTTIGEKLDAIVNGVMATLFKTGQSPDAEGQGFIDVESAFKALSTVMTPVIPGFAARAVLKLAARSQLRQARLRAAAVIPQGVVSEYRSLHSGIQGMVDHLQAVEELHMPSSDVDAALARQIIADSQRQAELTRQYPELPFRASLLGRLQLALGGGR